MKRNNFLESFFGDMNIFNSPFFNLSKMDTIHNFNNGFPKDSDPAFNKTEENVETEHHTTKKEVWTSIDGTQKFERSSMHSKMGKTSKVLPKEKLITMLEEAVEKQDFEEAIKLRDQLKDVK